MNTKINNNSSEFDIYKFVSVIVMLIFVSMIVIFIIYSSNSSSETPTNNIETDNTVTTAPKPVETTTVSTPAETTKENPYVSTVQVVDAPATKMALLYPDVVLKETTDAGQEYIDNIIFLGDSTTNGLRSYRMLKDGRETTQVWTPVNGTLTLSQASIATILYPETSEEITIAEAVERKQPSILLITLGVNGVSFMDETYFKSEYKKMLETIQSKSPNTYIILQSVFPVARSYSNQNQINNEKISAANEWIASIANDMKLPYLDTYSVLVGEDGFLPEELQNGDGIHLNETGFNIELNYIRTHALITR
ncbi:MAG: GDSL-type esterase/lipase family protein [Oscillospiraceae bacterium]|nr:GDSL-type esterase/lipase family protein [Oscillospiraceae bacterium]